MRGLGVFQCRNLQVLQLPWRGADLRGPQSAGRGPLVLGCSRHRPWAKGFTHQSTWQCSCSMGEVGNGFASSTCRPPWSPLRSPFLGRGVLRQASLCSGLSRLQKPSPACFRTGTSRLVCSSPGRSGPLREQGNAAHSLISQAGGGGGATGPGAGCSRALWWPLPP